MNQGSLLKAALLGGILAGVVSSVPYLSLLCCLWVMGGGAFAAWTLVSDSGGGAGLGRCAAAGFLSGLFGGALCAPLSGLVNRLVYGPEALEAQVEQAIAMVGSGGDALAPEQIESFARGAAFLEFNAGSVLMIVMMAGLFSFLGLLGGLLGGAMFGRKQAARADGFPPPFPTPPAAWTPPEAGALPEQRGELSPDELPQLPRADEDPEP